MVCWHTLLWRNVAEHSFLLVIVAAHSLASLDFLHSDEFPELKLQQKCVFQQTARERRDPRPRRLSWLAGPRPIRHPLYTPFRSKRLPVKALGDPHWELGFLFP